jgi:hypothetical protein
MGAQWTSDRDFGHMTISNCDSSLELAQETNRRLSEAVSR